MDTTVIWYDPETLRFKTISDFKDSLDRGGEIVIEWKGEEYGIFNNGERVYICAASLLPLYFDTADELLEYRVGGDRLRDVITEVEVIERAV